MPVRLTYWATRSAVVPSMLCLPLSLSLPLRLSLHCWLLFSVFLAFCNRRALLSRLSELLNSLYKNAYMTAPRQYLRILQILERNAVVFITRLHSLACPSIFPGQISLSFSRFHTAKQFQTFSADAFSFCFFVCFFPFFFFVP